MDDELKLRVNVLYSYDVSACHELCMLIGMPTSRRLALTRLDLGSGHMVEDAKAWVEAGCAGSGMVPEATADNDPMDSCRGTYPL